MDDELKQAGENLGLHTAIAMLLASQDKLQLDALNNVGRAMLVDLDTKSSGHPDVYQMTVLHEAMKTLDSISSLARAIRDGEIEGALGGAGQT